MTKELKSIFGDDWIAADKLVLSAEDEVWYALMWLPLDGPVGKWYDADGFAGWLAAFCSAGQLYQVSEEESGGL